MIQSWFNTWDLWRHCSHYSFLNLVVALRPDRWDYEFNLKSYLVKSEYKLSDHDATIESMTAVTADILDPNMT